MLRETANIFMRYAQADLNRYGTRQLERFKPFPLTVVNFSASKTALMLQHEPPWNAIVHQKIHSVH